MRATAWGALVGVTLLTIGCSSGSRLPDAASGRRPTAATGSTATSGTTGASRGPGSAGAASSPGEDPTAGTDAPSEPAPNGDPTRVVLDLVDSTRPTITSGGTFVSATRTLPTTVWLPGGTGPFPLVVFAHGYQVGIAPYQRFAGILVDAGYAVAAPSFPLTDESRAGANLDENDIDHEGADVSFVLTGVLTDPAVGPRIDADHVAVAGHSDGASVAIQVGLSSAVADPRIKAVVALTAGPLGAGPLHGPPVLLAQSDVDEYNDLSTGTELYAEITSTRWFLTLHGATHLAPVQGATPWTAIQDETVVAFLDRYLAGRELSDDDIAAAANAEPGLASIYHS